MTIWQAVLFGFLGGFTGNAIASLCRWWHRKSAQQHPYRYDRKQH